MLQWLLSSNATPLRSLAALAFAHLTQSTAPKTRLQPNRVHSRVTPLWLVVSGGALVNLSEPCGDYDLSKIIGELTEIKP